jgi:hypothetical protein
MKRLYMDSGLARPRPLRYRWRSFGSNGPIRTTRPAPQGDTRRCRRSELHGPSLPVSVAVPGSPTAPRRLSTD